MCTKVTKCNMGTQQQENKTLALIRFDLLKCEQFIILTWDKTFNHSIELKPLQDQWVPRQEN